MTSPNANPIEAPRATRRERGFVAIAIAVALAVGGLVWLALGFKAHYIAQGKALAEQACKADNERATQATRVEHNQDVVAGNSAASAALGDERQLRANATQLDRERRHANLIAAPEPRRVAAPRGDADDHALHPAADAASSPPGADMARGPDATPADADPVAHLSLDAVRLWNSALLGLPTNAGACGAAAGATGACAADSGLTLDDAWDNQAVNALSCSIDRARYRRLVDFLKTRQPVAP
ncbi:hypothetical protein ACFJGW_00640 [Burkholderiaceae bacterium UC74_6]